MSKGPSDIPASIGIGITTKDRWDNLAVTLEKLRHHELCGLEIIVIDDGSSEPMPTVFRQRFAPRTRRLRLPAGSKQDLATIYHRKTLRGDHQGDEDLQSVRTVIARVTPRGALNPCSLSFKIGAR